MTNYINETNVFAKGPNHILSSKQLELKNSMANNYFAWTAFDLNLSIKGFILNLIDPLMNSAGYLISLRHADDILTERKEDNSTPKAKSNEVLELHFLSDEKQVIKQIKDFVCKRHGIKTIEFVKALKSASKQSKDQNAGLSQEDTIVGEYFASHEQRNAVKTIRMFNMKTINLIPRSNTVGTSTPRTHEQRLQPEGALGDQAEEVQLKKFELGYPSKKQEDLEGLEPDVRAPHAGAHHDDSREEAARPSLGDRPHGQDQVRLRDVQRPVRG